MSDGKVVFDIIGDTSGIDKSLDKASQSIQQNADKWTKLGNTAATVIASNTKQASEGVAALVKNAASVNIKPIEIPVLPDVSVLQSNASKIAAKIPLKVDASGVQSEVDKVEELVDKATQEQTIPIDGDIQQLRGALNRAEAAVDASTAPETVHIKGDSSELMQDLSKVSTAIAKQTAKWTAIAQVAVHGIMSLIGKAARGFADLAKNAFEYNASMETYEVNFRTLLGSAEAAQAKLAELKDYAAKTPFAMDDLAGATQTLLAFGLNSEEASLALKHLGDISLGDANKLNSLNLAFAQVSSAGKLAGQDLLQMINAGFNPLNVIAEKTGAAYADLKAVMSGEKTSEDFQLRMEAARREVEELGTSASEGAIMLAQIGKDGMISADMVAAAMRIATSEGGAFYKALENASKTAKGQIATIQDSWNMLTGKMTGGVFDALSQEALPKIIGWLDELNAAFDENGFTGLKTAAGRIFGEIGGMALNLGSELIAKLYNGLTGDTKTAEEVKGYLSGLWTDASTALTAFTDAAGGLLGTIYTTLTGQEATAQNISNTIGGVFSAGGSAITDLMTTAATFFTELDEALGAPDASLGERIAGIFTAGSNAMLHLLNDAGSFMSRLYEAVTGDTEGAANMQKWVDNLFATAEEVEARSKESGAKEGFSSPTELLNRAQTMYASPMEYGITEAQADEWISVLAQGIQHKNYNAVAEAVMNAYSQRLAREQAAQEKQISQTVEQLDEQIEEEPVELPVEVTLDDGAETSLQSELDAMHFSTTVDATIIPHLSPLDRLTMMLPSGWSGQDHASGGIFTSATRFLGQDSLHTIGESGAEAVLPLDTLWRKMGLIFDQTFAANLDGLQYSIMPPLPAATPAGMDSDDLGEKIAECVREAISGLTVEMDRRVVGRILAPEISQNIAHDVNGRRWTS